MADARELRLLYTLDCKQYQSEARIYVEDAHPSGQRRLVVQYETGGHEGNPEFGAAIPNDWGEQDLQDLILWPRKHPDVPYPAWEVPARVHGSPELFRWWMKGEKPR
jgi:hypothetical protein